MSKPIHDVDQPMNANERYLYGLNVRLNILIEQVSAITRYIAEKDGVAVTKTEVQEEEVKPVEPVAKTTTRRTSTKKVTK